MLKTYEKGKAVQLSKNFKSTEFDCHGFGCCNSTEISLQLIDILQEVRDHFKKSVTINSGFRCKVHNKAVGGASKSNHLKGTAADIVVSGVEPKEVAKFLESIGVLGIGLYPWGCHVDTRTKKAFWYGDKQEYRSTFGGAPKENLTVLEWQKAALADGFSFPKYGADGEWGSECEAVAKKVICKKCSWSWKNKNLTKLIQKAVGVEVDGKFGNGTKNAVIKWQKLMGLNADGVVGYNTWKKILGVK